MEFMQPENDYKNHKTLKQRLKEMSKGALIKKCVILDAQVQELQDIINHYSKFSESTPQEVIEDLTKERMGQIAKGLQEGLGSKSMSNGFEGLKDL